MNLTSLSFADQGFMPQRYAFGKIDPQLHIALSENINPHFSWNEVPAGTKSFVMICHDYDVPSKPDGVNQEGHTIPADLPRVDFFHWVLVDIPANKTEIAEGEYSSEVVPRGKGGPHAANGTRQGVNDYTAWFASDHDMSGDYFGYDGPCPPWNDEILHHYVFTLYALDIEKLPLEGKFTGPEVLAAIETHVLGKATIGGIYSLNPDLVPRQVG
jgi:Raf kinase inhibitor-like YbhB/YbcL family protein